MAASGCAEKICACSAFAQLQFRGSGGFAPRFPTLCGVQRCWNHGAYSFSGPGPNAKSCGKVDAEMRLRPCQPRRMGRIAPRFSQRNQGLPCKCASGRSPDLRIIGPERLPVRRHRGQWLRSLRTLPSLHAYSYGVVADLHRASRTPEAIWIVSQACVRPALLRLLFGPMRDQVILDLHVEIGWQNAARF